MIANVIFILYLFTVVCSHIAKTSDNDFTVIETFNFPLNFSTENAECRSNINLFSDSLKNSTLWAYRMWESSARLPLGLTEGSQYQLGNFDECLSIKEPFTSQYCLATIHIDIKINRTNPDPFSLEYRPYMNLYEKLDYTKDPAQIPRNKVYWSLCLPASCPVEDIQRELEKYLNEGHNSYIKQIKVEINDDDCQTKEKNVEYKFTFKDILFRFVIRCFVFIVVISTIYDFKYCENDTENTEKSIKLLLCFSARKNYHELCKAEGTNAKFHIFYGFRVILMVGAITTHGLAIKAMGPIFNYNAVEKISRSSIYMLANRIPVPLEGFFIIGGILNTYTYLSLTNKTKFNALRSILLRYFRIIPIFGMMTFFYLTLFYKSGSGPLWPKIIGKEIQNCEKSWWTNFLLINNYVNVENSCVIQGWYVGLDFQLYILSIPLNYLIKRNSKLSWTIFTVIFLGAMAIPTLIIYIGRKDPVFYVFTNFLFTLREVDYFQSVYVPVHTRMFSYMVGMFFGFIYYKFRDSKLKISLIPSLFVFLIFGVMPMFASVFSGMFIYNPYIPFNILYGALYSTLHRVTFAIAAGILFFSLSYGSIPLTILTWGPMIPLSKLSFSAYMIHFVFQLTIPASTRHPLNLSTFEVIYRNAAELVMSFAAAFIMFIFIENPCSKFMKELIPLIFSKKRVRETAKSKEE